MSIYNIQSKKVHLGPIWMRTLLPRRMIGAWHLQTYMLLCDARTSSCTHILRWGACVSQDGVSKGGGGHSHGLYSHNCDRSRSAVNGQSHSKGCSLLSKHAQKHAVYGQSMLRSTENHRKTANLGGVTCEVKGQRPKISTVNSQTAEKSRSRF